MLTWYCALVRMVPASVRTMLAFLSASISAMRRRVSAYFSELVPGSGGSGRAVIPCPFPSDPWSSFICDVALMAGLPVGLGDDRFFLLLDGGVEFFQAVHVLLGEHGHVDGLGERAAEVGVAGVGGRAGELFEGGVEVRSAGAEGGNGGEDLGDGLAVLGRRPRRFPAAG